MKIERDEKIEKQRERHRQWYYDHKDEIKEQKRLKRLEKLAENPNYDKEWYAKYRGYYRQYDKDNKEQRIAYQKNYREEHKEEISEIKKNYHSTQFGRAVNICSTYTQSDKERNRGECTLTPQWIVDNIFSKSCIYCGESDWHKLGCDRIDNNLPHTPENVVCSCWDCNNKRKNKPFKVFFNETQNNTIHTSI